MFAENNLKILKQNRLKIFGLYIFTILVTMIISYALYGDFSILYIIETLFIFGIYSVLYNKQIYFDDTNFKVVSTSFFRTKTKIYSFDDISIVRNLSLIMALRIKDETVVIDAYKYKNSDFQEFKKLANKGAQ